MRYGFLISNTADLTNIHPRNAVFRFYSFEIFGLEKFKTSDDKITVIQKIFFLQPSKTYLTRKD